MQRALALGLLVVLGTVGGTTALPTGPAQADELAQNETAELPPGLTLDGVDDPLALAQAHQRTLRNVSHTMTATYAYRHTNGTLIGHGSTAARVAAGGAPFHVVWSRATTNATQPLGVGHHAVERYGDGNRTFVAVSEPGESTRYRELPGDGPLERPDSGWEGFYTAFSEVNTTVTERWERDGTSLYRVVSTEQPGPNAVVGADGSYTLSAVVDENGVVRTFQETRRAEFDGEPAEYVRTVRVTDVGNTTVDRPAWYQRAVENATA